ncbi:MAG: FHA domain-containing protein, partial [Anaerolineales bacterium]|nr:FHA domain-containing protein [Anaerolineales bacterium]
AQTAAGNADWADAVQKGLRLAASQAAHKRRAVILLSAGGADRGVETAVAEAQRLGVPVFAIGLGGQSPHTALETVAAQTGGTFVPADSAEALRAAFRAVTGQLRQVYSLRFTANLPADGGVHPLELTVQTPQGTAVSTAQFMARFPLIPAVRGVTAFVPEPAALPDLDWVRGRVTLQPDVVARNEITAVNYYVDGGQTAVFTASTAPWTFSWDTSDLAPGQTHTLLIEIVDAANPPHVGVYETAVFVHACPLACQIAQNSLLAGVLAAGVLGLGGLAVFWLVKSRSSASRQPTAVTSAPVARPGARRPSEAVVMMKQPDPLPPVSASTIVDDERPLVLQPPGLQGEGWPADLPTLDTQTAPSAASSAADFPRTEILAPNDGTIALAFLVDLNAGLEHRLAARTTLGSAADCDIILRDPSVAAHHARISWEDKKFALFATTAQYGLQVNGRDIIHAVLRSGDRLQIGRFTFVFKSIQ